MSATVVELLDVEGEAGLRIRPQTSKRALVELTLDQWGTMFGTDKDGDSVLWEAFNMAYRHADKDGKASIMAGMNKFFLKYESEVEFP
jgi:hypothetical protein